ncbi:iron complex transport system substrate-binding protein [Cohaesibacter sp. ES.047]|uniref:ABC transporter substrate-binding protein n=1 Tax=Cohaesibacter sp. ES.047 TaxID=1798205 RepID=UPI000BB7DF4C|nr:ABC transporter substrate-binding protein [Cohaesibacter sp. ES.047]SNY91040.1 iron complex transport system substrate-binding protein [Cohaesibacter sp. ES.047]
MPHTKIAALCGLALIAFSGNFATPASADEFPYSFDNCGSEVTIKAAPKRILLVNNSVLGTLISLDALDLLVGRTAEPVEGVYVDEVVEQFKTIPLLSKSRNSTGGSVISFETILATKPDLVLAPENAADRELLAKSGIPLYSPPAYCTDKSTSPQGRANFDFVYDELLAFGQAIGRADLAKDKVAELKASVQAQAPAKPGVNGTAVALYASAGGKVLYPYGARSMVTPVFEAAGLTNVYGETDERVFEGNVEDLIAKDPETIVMLYSFGAPEESTKTLKMIPALAGLQAVRNDRVIAFPFAYTDPPTPMSVKGVSVLLDMLKELQ